MRNRKYLSRIFKTKKNINDYIKKNNPTNFKNNEDLNNIEYLGIGLCNYNYKKSHWHILSYLKFSYTDIIGKHLGSISYRIYFFQN